MLQNPQLHFRSNYSSLIHHDEASDSVTCVGFCQSSDIICVATRNGKVSFFDTHGRNHLRIHDFISKESFYTSILLDSSQLIGGMENGQITSRTYHLYHQKQRDASKESKTNRDIHNNAVTHLKLKGNDLLSIDNRGYCCYWKVTLDNLVPIQSINVGTAINSIDILEPRSFAFSSSDGMIYMVGEPDIFVATKIMTPTTTARHENSMDHCSVSFVVCHRTKQDTLFVISIKNIIYECHVNPKGNVAIEKELKSTFDGYLKLVIISDLGQLVGLSQEGNLESIFIDDNRNELSVLSSPDSTEFEDNTTLIEYSSGILVAGTTYGRNVSLYQELMVNEGKMSKWIPIYNSRLDGFQTPLESIMISRQNILLRTGANIISLMKTHLLSAYAEEKYAIQIDDQTLMLFESTQKRPFAIIETFLYIHGISMDSEYICVWSEDNIQVYSHFENCEIFDEITMPVQTLAVSKRSLYISKGQSLLVTDLHGVIRVTIRIPLEDGAPLNIFVASDKLIMVTDNGTIKVMSVSNKTPEELFCHRSHLSEYYGIHTDSILGINTNAAGSLVSILHKNISGKTCLCLTELISGNTQKLESIVSDDELILTHHWDASDSRVLLCEVCNSISSESKVYLVFVEKSQHIYIHDNFKLDGNSSRILGVSLPFILQLDKHTLSVPPIEEANHTRGYNLNCIKVDGYENCEDADVHPSMIAKRTDFLLFLASGDLDRALICATHIKDISVWIRLGMACIKEENYKIARDCLENMDDRKNLLSIQPTIMDSVEGCREEFVFAELAIKLGMIGKASKICKKCDRMDILCNILKHHGLWNEAFDAAKNIPVLEKSLYFHYGKFMEDLGNINEAVTFYMKSSLPRRSLIPKMLHMGCDVERFAMESNDKELITLYASHMDNLNEHESAKTFYSIAKDTSSLIRIEYDVEAKIPSSSMLEEGRHHTTAYHIAKSLELKGDIIGALEYYHASRMFNHAMHLCQRYNYDDALMKMALESTMLPQQLSSAMYFFQTKRSMENAFILFMKGGDRENAINALLEIQLDHNNCQHNFELIYDLRYELPKDKVLECAALLMKIGCYDECSKIIESIECSVTEFLENFSKSGVLLNEAAVDCIIQKGKISRREDLISVAHECNNQGNFLLASALFTKAADTAQALTSLLKLGDTEKIIDFASTTNSAEVYTLAANYLQTLNYEDDPSIQKILLSFYMKAGKYSTIISLLTAWSEKEVFDGCYEMAFSLLEEAQKYGLKIENWSCTKEFADIERKLKHIKDFLHARHLSQQGCINQAKEICYNLLKCCDRIMQGDCYGLLIEIENNVKLSYDLIQEMIQKKINPYDYIDSNTMKGIYESVGESWLGDDTVIKSLSDEDTTEDDMIMDDHLGLDEEEKSIIGYATARDWDSAREFISSSDNFSLAFICCICSKGPPQSVAVMIKRTKQDAFVEVDHKSRYPLHYLCYHGAPMYTILFVFHQCPNAISHRDQHGKTPLEYALDSSWEHGEMEEKHHLIKELEQVQHHKK